MVARESRLESKPSTTKFREKTKRGHGRQEVIAATKLMKDFGFKICYHLMPGLPGSTPAKDLQWMREVFENPDFCPDFVKIYPCVVARKR